MSERAIKRVLLVGATGLVGRAVIGRGRHIPGLALIGLARREMDLPRGGPMEMVIAPTENWPELIAKLAPHAVICALGTTQARSGKAGLEAIDRELVLVVAGAAKAAGTRVFVQVSSVGADAQSRGFYLRVKGEAEQGLRALQFDRLDILRPGLLRGPRPDDARPAERVWQALAPLADLALQGAWQRYRSIAASEVAAAALQAVRDPGRGPFVHEHADLRRLAARLAQGPAGC